MIENNDVGLGRQHQAHTTGQREEKYYPILTEVTRKGLLRELLSTWLPTRRMEPAIRVRGGVVRDMPTAKFKDATWLGPVGD
jgi:hypothetical protein